MPTISELTNRVIKATDRTHRKECADPLECRIPPGTLTTRHALYEVEVFNFLYAKKKALGIESVIRFKNLIVDGQLVLTSGRRLALEIKLRMNWLKACQSEYLFRQFLKRTKRAQTDPVDGAVVFFEEFSGDWSRKKGKAKNLWGWEAWYLFHNVVEGKPMDLSCWGRAWSYEGIRRSGRRPCAL